MPRNTVSKTINELWQKVFVDKELVCSQAPETRPRPFSTRHQTIISPASKELHRYYPIRRICYAEKEFQARYFCGSGIAAQTACTLVTEWAQWVRDKIFYTFGHAVPASVHVPNPFFFLFRSSSIYPSDPGAWSADTILELEWQNDRPSHPHVTMTATQDFPGNDSSMLWGELVPLVQAMHSRANQPLVVEEEEMRKLWDERAVEFPDKPRVFPKEKRFPVLMLSFLTNQHARIFYAYMEGKSMIIRQSKSYNFQSRDDAVVELFVSFLLSSPLV